jgi:hypothetical protein
MRHTGETTFGSNRYREPDMQHHVMKPALIIATLITFVFPIQAKPLKVFVLAGQSNMEGPASIKTFDYIGDDPATAPLLKMMRGADGKPTVCDHVWISYLTGDGEKTLKSPAN